MPIFDAYTDPNTVAQLARDAEAAGWDGFFIWDHILFDPHGLDVGDPWVVLAAVAAATERITIGTLVTPIPRRRPWVLARQAVSLDQLSHGRLVLGVGIGDPAEIEFGAFGEETDTKARARMLDEGLDIITGLWSGEPFSYNGEHYSIDNVQFLPRPTRRIPIWVAGVWPGTKPFRRAAQWDGVAPIASGETTVLQPEDVRAMLAFIRQHRAGEAPFEVLLSGPPLRLDQYAAYAEAGATWYQDSFMWEDSLETVREHIRRGPPR